MRLFRSTNSQPGGEHLPANIPAECIAEKCSNYQGELCQNTEMEWMSAGGPTEKRDVSRPPLKDEATYIIYGQRCLVADKPKLVAQRVEIFKPEEIGMMGIIALTGRYGDMPVEVINGSMTTSIETIASND